VDHKPVLLVAGEHLTITPEQIEGTAQRVSTVFTTLAENLKPGDQVLLSDGLIELRVVEIKGVDVVTQIINGGMLGEKKGINLPGVAIKVPSLTEKDEEDLVFAIKAGCDTIAVSFVQTADDVRYAKSRIAALGSDAWVIAKLEKPQAIDHLDSILEAADAIMVARGDLGVEVPPEKVPAIQKHIIRRAAEYRKPVITATQMLESMIENPRPTRAEASDVANAIYDGSDAVMLSAESAAGKYPVESVAMMNKIVMETEAQIRMEPPVRSIAKRRTLTIPETICECMAHSAQDLDLAAIAIFTESGNTARLLSKYRPEAPIYALSPFEAVVHRSMLLWGTYPIRCDRFEGTDTLVNMAEQILESRGLVQSKQVVGIVAGTATKTGATNFMRLHLIGDR
jgi:pyruvate kinase